MNWQPMPKPSIDQAAQTPGEYLTALCRESGRTQADIAEQLGMTARSFRVHLNGQRKKTALSYAMQYAVESIVGAQVVRKVRRALGQPMPRK